MTLIRKYLTILNGHKFLIWAVCVSILGLLVTFRLLGDDLSKTAGIVITIVGIIAIFYSLYSKKRNIRP